MLEEKSYDGFISSLRMCANTREVVLNVVKNLVYCLILIFI